MERQTPVTPIRLRIARKRHQRTVTVRLIRQRAPKALGGPLALIVRFYLALVSALVSALGKRANR